MLHDLRHRLVAHILRHGSGDIFLEAVEADGVADIHHLEDLGPVQRILVDAVAIGLIGAEIIDDLGGRHVPLLVVQTVDIALTEYIRHKPEPLCLIGHGELVLIVRVQHDTEIADDRVPVPLHDLYDPGDLLVESLVLLGRGVVHAVVLYGDRVGQLIVGQEIPVSVVDVSPGPLYGPGLLYLDSIILKIGLSIHDLELEKPSHQNGKHDTEDDDGHNCPSLEQFVNS